MGARTGKEYLDALDNKPREIWVGKEKLSRNLSQHHAFRSIAHSIAHLYDMQHDPKLKNEMTYKSPTSGMPVGMSFLQPKTIEDLFKRRTVMQHWANYSCGMLGRTPDFINSQIMAFASAAEFFGKNDPKYATNIINYYEYIRENDLLLAFTMTHPMANKALGWNMQTNPFLAARIVEKNKQGVVIKGARMILSNPLADEIFVFPAHYTKMTQEDIPYTFAFAIPTSTAGIKLICRESYSKNSKFDHPLASRFKEQDAFVIFNNVLVPWERIFLLEDMQISNTFLKASGGLNHMIYQVLNRNIIKTEFLLGLITSITNIKGLEQFQYVQEMIAEVIINLEILKALLRASEADACLNEWNIFTPALTPLNVAKNFFPRIYPQIRNIIYQLSGSSLISLPTEEMMNSEIRKDIDEYFEAKNTNAIDRIKLFHLAWDIAGSAFASRQEMHDKFFLGDPLMMMTTFYKEYNTAPFEKKIWSFLHS